ncbi:MAG TPA: hypothetical protein VGT79_06335 [Xanthomonadaceae bacterium]|nr:hypothetical protein [Xanthomonadaceae bacterium]
MFRDSAFVQVIPAQIEMAQLHHKRRGDFVRGTAFDCRDHLFGRQRRDLISRKHTHAMPAAVVDPQWQRTIALPFGIASPTCDFSEQA